MLNAERTRCWLTVQRAQQKMRLPILMAQTWFPMQSTHFRDAVSTQITSLFRNMARSSNYAWTHVMTGANPQALQPPLQGEVPPTGGGGVNRVSELGRCMCC